jgi:uncharacterized protein YciI
MSGKKSRIVVGGPIKPITGVIQYKTKEAETEAPKEKKEINVAELQDRMKVLEEGQKALKEHIALLTKSEEKDDTEEIKELTLNVGGSFVLLPQLGGVKFPFSDLERPLYISVGSLTWLKSLDILRTYGYPRSAIEDFLQKSAEVVNRDAITTGDCTKDNVEEFCTW